MTPGVEIKGAVHAREMPRLRHVFLDNLFGNINHRERHEMLEGVRASVQRGFDARANVMLPVLYPRSPRRRNARRIDTADESPISRLSRENDALHPPCLGLFYSP